MLLFLAASPLLFVSPLTLADRPTHALAQANGKASRSRGGAVGAGAAAACRGGGGFLLVLFALVEVVDAAPHQHRGRGHQEHAGRDHGRLGSPQLGLEEAEGVERGGDNGGEDDDGVGPWRPVDLPQDALPLALLVDGEDKERAKRPSPDPNLVRVEARRLQLHRTFRPERECLPQQRKFGPLEEHLHRLRIQLHKRAHQGDASWENAKELEAHQVLGQVRPQDHLIEACCSEEEPAHFPAKPAACGGALLLRPGRRVGDGVAVEEGRVLERGALAARQLDQLVDVAVDAGPEVGRDGGS
mmetsp:Transcript_3567/g.9286  ORF Transcript_3567/g.9286 Transcript_3567/m.9286 type:complete len:300 (+) Transcript_3567:279-1178(+)